MKKTKKMMAGVAATLVAVSVTACSSQEEVQTEYVEDDNITSTTLPPEPTDAACSDWDWDDETGTYYCDDTRSSNFGMYYLMGQMFNSKSALKSSSKYKSYQQSYRPVQDETNTSTSSGGSYYGKPSSSSSSSDTSSYKSGIGSGSKGGYGG